MATNSTYVHQRWLVIIAITALTFLYGVSGAALDNHAPRTREELDAILLDETGSEAKTIQYVNRLREIYSDKIRPAMDEFNYESQSGSALTETELTAKPLVLLVGSRNTGKTQTLHHLLNVDAAPPADTARFTVYRHAARAERLDARRLADAEPAYAWGQLPADADALLEAVGLPHALLKRALLVDTPSFGLPGLSTYYDETLAWFVDRASNILLFFEPNNLEITVQLKQLLGLIKGRELALGIVLNKADEYPQAQLMRAYRELIWYVCPLLNITMPPRVYLVSLAPKGGADRRSGVEPHPMQAEMEADELKLARDIAWAADGGLTRRRDRVALVRHLAKRVRQHAVLADAFAGAFRANRGVFRKANQRMAREIVRAPRQFGVITRARQQAQLLTPPDVERYTAYFQRHPLADQLRIGELCKRAADEDERLRVLCLDKDCSVDLLDQAIEVDLRRMLKEAQEELKEKKQKWKDSQSSVTSKAKADKIESKPIKAPKIPPPDKPVEKGRKSRQKEEPAAETPAKAPTKKPEPVDDKPPPETIKSPAPKKSKPPKPPASKPAEKPPPLTTESHTVSVENVDAPAVAAVETPAVEVHTPPITPINPPISSSFASAQSTDSADESAESDSSTTAVTIDLEAPNMKVACKFRKSCYETGELRIAEAGAFVPRLQETAVAASNVDPKVRCKFRKSCYETGELPPDVGAVYRHTRPPDVFAQDRDEAVDKRSLKERCRYRTSCYTAANPNEWLAQYVAARQQSPDGRRPQQPLQQAAASVETISLDVDDTFRFPLKLRCKFRKSCYETGVVPEVRRAPLAIYDAPKRERTRLSPLEKKNLCKYRKGCYERLDDSLLDSDWPTAAAQTEETHSKKPEVPEEDATPPPPPEDIIIDLEALAPGDIKLACKFRPSCYETGVITPRPPTLRSSVSGAQAEGVGPVDVLMLSELQKKVICKYRRSCYETGQIPGRTAKSDDNEKKPPSPQEDVLHERKASKKNAHKHKKTSFEGTEETAPSEPTKTVPTSSAKPSTPKVKKQDAEKEDDDAPEKVKKKDAEKEDDDAPKKSKKKESKREKTTPITKPTKAAKPPTKPKVKKQEEDSPPPPIIVDLRGKIDVKLACKFRPSCYETGVLSPPAQTMKTHSKSAPTVVDFNSLNPLEKKVFCRYRTPCYETGIVPELRRGLEEAAVEPEPEEVDLESMKESDKRLRCKFRKSCYDSGVVPVVVQRLSVWSTTSTSGADEDDEMAAALTFDTMNTLQRKLFCQYRPSCYETGVKPTIVAREVDEDEAPSGSVVLTAEEFEALAPLAKKNYCRYRVSCYETGVLPSMLFAHEAAEGGEHSSAFDGDTRQLSMADKKVLCKFKKTCLQQLLEAEAENDDDAGDSSETDEHEDDAKQERRVGEEAQSQGSTGGKAAGDSVVGAAALNDSQSGCRGDGRDKYRKSCQEQRAKDAPKTKKLCRKQTNDS